MLLEFVGHEVRAAHDGLKAVALVAEFQPHVVLLDIGLPVLNGYEVGRAHSARARHAARSRRPHRAGGRPTIDAEPQTRGSTTT